MTSRQIEMTWRCTSCSAKNLGRFKGCQTCNNPKDGSEEYEMPEDPSKAASVTEASLVRMALAGPNWRCAYCGSDQRRDDRGCASCGASALEGTEVPDAAAPPDDELEEPPERNVARWVFGAAAALVALIVFGAFLSWNQRRPKDFEAHVTDVYWSRVIEVQRYQAQSHEGFKENLPEGALEVKSLGQREHHQEQVFDHNEDERYSVEVPDGYRTETYSEREACGETCSGSEEKCSEKCTSNKNGFATCKTTCTGGGRSCSTKYCDRQRTRQIAKTRSESRTRVVARYRSEPRYAEAFSWVSWEWVPARSVRAEGTDVTAHWPDAKLNVGLAPGEKEREARAEKYRVTLGWDETKNFIIHTEEEAVFTRYAPGTQHTLHTEGGAFLLDGAPVPSSP